MTKLAGYVRMVVSHINVRTVEAQKNEDEKCKNKVLAPQSYYR
jgi:hypothetical protein